MSLFTARAIALICSVIAGLPLLLYPFVLMSTAMSLGAPKAGDEPILVKLLAYGFLLSYLAYPLVYGACLIILVPSWLVAPPMQVVVLSLMPIGYLLLVAALYGLGITLDKPRERTKAQRDTERVEREAKQERHHILGYLCHLEQENETGRGDYTTPRADAQDLSTEAFGSLKRDVSEARVRIRLQTLLGQGYIQAYKLPPLSPQDEAFLKNIRRVQNPEPSYLLTDTGRAYAIRKNLDQLTF